MADIRAFKSLHYEFNNELAEKVTPPYDVISRDKKEELLSRHDHNSIHLTLGDPSTLTDQEFADTSRYKEAQRKMQLWIKEGVLIQDDVPAMYIVEDEFEWQGEIRKRKGILCVIRLEEFGTGSVLPHEQTLAAPIEDRLALMHATGLHTSPIYMTFDDGDGHVRKILDDVVSGNPIAEFPFHDQKTRHRIWKIDSSKTIATLQGERTVKIFSHCRWTSSIHNRAEIHER